MRKYYPVSIRNQLSKVCEDCESTEDLEIHHIEQIWFGGSNEIDYLKVLCKTCHKKTRPNNPFPNILEALSKVRFS
ncbi:HNH endonuclease [Candidatus Bathyarchaeota archaeon]|nr:MAG: HNH endonuclease [Candidatus Bathyarchaeota archaeon]